MADGFKIADGYVDVHAEVDETSARRAANEVTDIVGDESERTGRRHSFRIFAALFTPNEAVLHAMRTGVPAVLSSPIGIAAVTLGVLFASSFIGAVLGALALGGLGAAFVGLAAFALREVDSIRHGFMDMLDEIGEGLKLAAMPLMPAFKDAFALVVDIFNNQVYPLIKEIFTSLAPIIEPLTAAVGTAIVNFLRAVGDPAVLGPLTDFFIQIAPLIPQIATAMGQFFTTLAENAPVIAEAFGIVVDILSRAIEISASVIVILSHLLIIIKAKWDALWATLKEGGQSFLKFIGQVAEGAKQAWNTVVQFVQGRVDAVQARIQHARDAISRAWALLKENIINPIKQGIDGAIMWVRQLPSRAAAALGDIGSRLFQKGKELVQGFIAGIKSSLGAVGQAVGSILSFLPGSPVKTGPLVVLNQMSTNPGAKLARMLQEGFNTQMQAFTPALAGMGGATNVTVNPSIGNPPISVQVMLDGRQITPTVYAAIDERDLQIKRAVTSGGMRLP